MARLADLLAEIADSELRDALEREVRQLRDRTGFGLVSSGTCQRASW